jgi:hypothetical protein
MTKKMVQKDERTAFVEMASYSYGYKILSFGLLIDIMYRSFRYNEAPWDLFAIIIISSFAMTIYQYKHKILGTSWIKTNASTIVISIICAIVLTLIILT